MTREEFLEDFQEGDRISLYLGDMRLEGKLLKIRESSIRLQVSEGEEDVRTISLDRIWECQKISGSADTPSSELLSGSACEVQQQGEDFSPVPVSLKDKFGEKKEHHSTNAGDSPRRGIVADMLASSKDLLFAITADMLSKAGFKEKSLSILKNSLDNSSTHPLSLIFYLYNLKKSGRIDEALSTLENEIVTTPDSFSLWGFYATFLLQANRPKEASEAAAHCLRLEQAYVPKNSLSARAFKNIAKKLRQECENIVAFQPLFNTHLSPSLAEGEDGTAEQTKRSTISDFLWPDIEKQPFTDVFILEKGGIPSRDDALRLAKKAFARPLNHPIYQFFFAEAAKALCMVEQDAETETSLNRCLFRYALLKGDDLFETIQNITADSSSKTPFVLLFQADSAMSYYLEGLRYCEPGHPEDAALVDAVLARILRARIYARCLEDRKKLSSFSSEDDGPYDSLEKLLKKIFKSRDEGFLTSFWIELVIWAGTDSIVRLMPVKNADPCGVFATLKKNSELQNSFCRFMRRAADITKGDPEQDPRELYLKAVDRYRREQTIREQKFQKLLAVEGVGKPSYFRCLAEQLECATDNTPIRFLSELLVENLLKNTVDKVKNLSSSYEIQNTILAQAKIELNNSISSETSGGLLKLVTAFPTYYNRLICTPLIKNCLHTIDSIQMAMHAELRPEFLLTQESSLFPSEEQGWHEVGISIRNVGKGPALTVAIRCSFQKDGIDVHSADLPEVYLIEPEQSYYALLRVPSELSLATSAESPLTVSVAVESGQHSATERFTLVIDQGADFSVSELPWTFQRVPNRIYGRESLLDKLVSCLAPEERCTVRMLYGVTRSGKTSILDFLQKRVNGSFLPGDSQKRRIFCVNWNLSLCCDSENQLQLWQNLLRTSLVESRHRYENSCPTDVETRKAGARLVKDMVKQLPLAEGQGWPAFLQGMQELGLYPVFLVDEFGAIRRMFDRELVGPGFLMSIRQAALEDKAAFFFTGTYDIKELIADKRYGITGQFVNLDPIFVTRIEEKYARELVNSFEKLHFSPDAQNSILLHSDCRPYLIQMICLSCGRYAIESGRSMLGVPEVDRVIAALVGEKELSSVDKLPENRFQDNLIFQSEDSDGVLAAAISICSHQESNANGFVELEELNRIWEEAGLSEPLKVLTMLTEREVLEFRSSPVPAYRIRVPLFRRWWKISNPSMALSLEFAKEKRGAL